MWEAALPSVPLLLVALMLPVTLALPGLVNRRTTRYKCCVPAFGSTCTVTLTSFCRDESDTQLTTTAQVWVADEVKMLEEEGLLSEALSKQSGLINRQQAKVKRGKSTNAGMQALHLQSQQDWKPASSTTKILARTRALPFGRGVE